MQPLLRNTFCQRNAQSVSSLRKHVHTQIVSLSCRALKTAVVAVRNETNVLKTTKINNVGKLVHTDTDKAGLLNNYFSSVFTIDNGIIDPSRLPDIPLTTFAVPPVFFTPALISKYIKALKRNGSAGPDGLPAEFFKETSNTISFPLTVIFNLSLQTGDLPDMRKNASVTPVLKKGSPCAPENYRPLNLYFMQTP